MNKRPHISPPKWADRFLELYCKEQFLEEIQGDVHELFEARINKQPPVLAKAKFIWDVLRFFKWSNLKKSKRLNSNIITMTRNNFKVAARVLWKQKTNTALNIGSIAIGMACFILISLYVRQELSFDKFHEKGDRIYRTWAKEDYGEGQQFFYTSSPLPLAGALEANIPEVEATVRVDYNRFLVGEGENRINELVSIVSPNFFDVFTFNLNKGNAAKPLGRQDVVLSEEYAQKYFGSDDAVGKELVLQIGDEQLSYQVSAVMENMPRNTGFQADMIVSNEDMERFYSPRALQAWFNIAPETFVLLKENASVESVEAKLPGMIRTVLADEVQEGEYVLGLQPLTDIHLNTDFPAAAMPVGNPNYVYVLATIGLLVLIMACMNYTTLSTGQSIKRAKEVGIRKVVGAQKKGLVWQYLSESLLITAFAALTGFGLAYLLLPTFNQLAGTQIAIPVDYSNVILFLGIVLTVGILTGLYPAFVLSNLKLLSVLKGAQSSKGAGFFRKSLMVFQLLLTIFLISGSMVMRSQLNFLQNSDLGYEREAMVYVNLYSKPDASGLIDRINSGFENAEILKSKLQTYPDIKSIGTANHMFGTSGWTGLGFSDKQGQFRQFSLLITDAYYNSSFGIELVAGRDFDPELEIDKTESIIINEAAAAYFFNTESPLGKQLPGNDFGTHRIVGVVKDFNFQSLHTEVSPLIITQNARPMVQGASDFSINSSPIPKVFFKYTGNSLLGVQSLLEETWAGTFPNEELSFSFIDERLRLMYENESRVNQIAGIATIISILIASFGLLGLTIMVVNNKIKEIGIRKVLGAPTFTILSMLLRQFSQQLILAFIISIPITWYLMNQWLSDFAYRVDVGVMVFLISGVLSFSIMFLVISYHAVRASRSNPIKALRVE
ncbi:ABC transporter permease [Roseivirga sp. E12]|uniref:ABC transporter permease n=1 Tax=Roseivirga sp. E12 TaxID=2819237 RepID=UPI001ABC476D|nr:ABC transporter permease [Roseivirga sp. E12]MBO3697431.1 ABC transporter permease [Roseivirga sp. E12]